MFGSGWRSWRSSCVLYRVSQDDHCYAERGVLIKDWRQLCIFWCFSGQNKTLWSKVPTGRFLDMHVEWSTFLFTTARWCSHRLRLRRVPRRSLQVRKARTRRQWISTLRLGRSGTWATAFLFWFVMQYFHNIYVLNLFQDPSYTFSGVSPAPVPKDEIHKFFIKFRVQVVASANVYIVI